MQMNLITNYKEKIVLFSLRSLTIVFYSTYQTLKVSIMVPKATFRLRTEVFLIIDNNTEQYCSKKRWSIFSLYYGHLPSITNFCWEKN